MWDLFFRVAVTGFGGICVVLFGSRVKLSGYSQVETIVNNFVPLIIK